MRRYPECALGLVLVVVLLLAAPAGAAERGAYIVRLAATPAGSPPEAGKASAARAHRRSTARVAALQARALRAAGGGQVLHRYRHAFPGFAARLTPAQAARMQEAPGVVAVTKDGRVRAAATVRQATGDPRLRGESSDFLELPQGLWARLGGARRAGEGIVVGVIDSGIRPEHPSFADEPRRGGRERYLGAPFEAPGDWRGACETGPAFPLGSCNGKLIGARFFVEGFGRENLEGDFPSPIDVDGHGTHVASTAAGNYGVDPVEFGHDLGVDRISGLAPRAWVSHYKALWTGRFEGEGAAEPGIGMTSDLVAAVDAAVSDGVDVLNLSLGDTVDVSPASPLSVALLFAADAGVFVAASAGNEGPGAETVSGPASAPWVTAVGATTLARTFTADATVRDAAGAPPVPLTVSGTSVTAALPEAPLVDAAGVPAAGRPAEEAELCLDGALNPERVRGHVVLCRRGVSFLAEKSRAVLAAGGVGVITYDQAPELAGEVLGAVRHWVPTVMVDHAEGLAVKALIAAAERPVATFTAGVATPGRPDVLAQFSSRGPVRGVADLVKPDLVAPGVHVLAGYSPVTFADDPPGDLFHAYDGTSMASPHVAGVAALLRQLHPGWSPAAVRSALVLTATPEVTTTEGAIATPLEAGAGRIVPNAAAAPGLVLEAATEDYLRYLDTLDPEFLAADLPPREAADLNLPSLGDTALVGMETTERTVRSVLPGRSTWRVEVEGAPGVTVEPGQETFTLDGGERHVLPLRFTTDGAAPGGDVFGRLVLRRTDGRQVLRLPLALRPALLDAPAELAVSAAAADGARALRVRTGYDGRLSAVGRGLAPPETLRGETVATTTTVPDPRGDAGSRLYPVTVPEGAELLAAEIGNFDGGDRTTDLDLFAYHDDEGDGFDEGDLVEVAASLDPEERIAVTRPAAGRWLFLVLGFATRSPTSSFDLSRWLVDDPTPDDLEDAPALAVTGDPVEVRRGQEAELELRWAGVEAGEPQYGLVTYHDRDEPGEDGEIAHTIVRLDRE